MSFPVTQRDYAINRVSPRTAPKLSQDLLRGIVVRHPLTRCSNPAELNRTIAVEESTDGLVSCRNYEHDTYFYNLPVVKTEIPEFIASSNYKLSGKTNRLSLDEIDLLIRGKLSRQRHNIKQLFKENAADEGNNVSRGALLKIFTKLCPLITTELFYRLLERYELNKEALVSFRQFEEAFTAQPLGKRAPPVIFYGLGAERCVSVAQAYRMLQEIACDPKFDLKRILPPSCFEPDGRVLCPQLREAMKLMRINLTDENYRRLWRDKIDLEHFGSVSTDQICRILNLKEDGTPLGPMAKVTPLQAAKLRGIPKLNRNPRLMPSPKWASFEMLPTSGRGATSDALTLKSELPVAGGTSYPITEQHAWTPNGPGGAMDPVFGCGERYNERLAKLETHFPRFEDIMSCLRYKLENPYQAMLVAFKRFDPRHDNRVPENICLNILREYGLSITPDDLSVFLRRILSSSEATGSGLGRDKPPGTIDAGVDEVKIRPGLVPYKRLLGFYQNGSKGGPASQIMRKLSLRNSSTVDSKKVTMLTPDEIEEELVKILHSSFIEFSELLNTQKVSSQGIEEHRFRDIVNRMIGFTMSDLQWDELKKHTIYIEPGVINYEDFLNLFNHPSNVAQRQATSVFDATKSHCPPKSDEYRGEVRDKTTLLRLVEHTIRTRLHHIDKCYKHCGHKKENMVSKEEFGELLASQGLQIVPAELDYLWGLLDELEPNRELHKYRQVMNFFYNRTRPIVAESIRLKRHETSHDPNVERLKTWRKAFRQQQIKDKEALLKAGRIVPTLTARSPPPDKPTDARLTELCKKIERTLSNNWDATQHAFIDADKSGTGSVLLPSLKEVAARFNFALNDSELVQLFRGFESRDKDYFNYVRFMQYFAQTLPKEKLSRTQFDERLYQFTNLKNGQKLSFADVLGEIRKSCLGQCRTLQEAFRKLDTNRHGNLTIEQIGKLLRTRGVFLSEDDLYHLLTSFDSCMSGSISFAEFKQTTLKAFKPGS
ncbi:hypothetical protein P879_04402 [Paragonimus westermani]|uniref:EF-hand domain-containing protein n=1 Tax=Paragonimus westermani TaxID=34504 RepID=A0A8T0D5B0_9TREM|nr:hypothetical protein P879_04402 [Paragonimus westermani]